MLSHQLFALLLIVCTLLFVGVNGLEPAWCSPWKQQQQQTTYSLCEKHNGKDLTDELQGVASWCKLTNYKASLPITFKDPSLKCSDPNSHCITPPISQRNITDDLVCDPVYNTDFATKLNDALGPLNSNGNLQQYCHAVTYAIPFELEERQSTATHQLLFLATQSYISFVSLNDEKVLRTVGYLQDDSTQIGFTFVRVITDTHVNSANRKEVHIVATSQKRLYDFKVYFDAGELKYELKYESLMNGDVVLDLEAFDDRSVPNVVSSWAAVLIRRNDGRIAVRYFELKLIGNDSPNDAIIEWTLSFDQTTTSSFIRLTTVEHYDYDLDALESSSVGCFKPRSIRTMIVVNTHKYIWMMQFHPGLQRRGHTIHNVDMKASGDNLYYSVDANQEITSVNAFGECFGHIQSIGQKLWFTLGLRSTTSGVNTLTLHELVEFSLVNIKNCYTDNMIDQWKKPTAIVYGSTCESITIPATCDKRTKYFESGQCKNRKSITPKELPARAIDIKVRFQSHSVEEQLTPAKASNSFINQIFVASGRTISIFGFQEMACSGDTIFFEKYNDILGSDNLLSLEVSENSQHVFASVMKYEWQVTSNQRLNEICNELSDNSQDNEAIIFLEKFRSICEERPPSAFTIYDFIKYYSLCNSGWYCPRFGYATNNSDVVSPTIYETVMPGDHVIRPLKHYQCEPGFYCPELSDAMRRPCPVGFKCPNARMTTPEKCEAGANFDISCHVEGLASEVTCPEGYICMDPVTPTPAPPGYYVRSRNRASLYKCEHGAFCPLGTQNETLIGQDLIQLDINCPQGSYCEKPGVIMPEQCTVQEVTVPTSSGGQLTTKNQTLYCPKGTASQQPCPAGFYCPTPTERIGCEDGFFCPAGSVSAKPCPAGYYCLEPGVSIICPKGSFCREGTVNPTKCQFLVRCPQGTSKPSYTFTAILINGIVLLLVFLVFIVIKAINLYNRRQKKKGKRELEKKSFMQKLGLGGIEKKMKSFTAGRQLDDYISHMDEDDGDRSVKPDYSLLLPKKTYRMDFELKNLSFTKKRNDKVLFEGVNAKIHQGRITMIMGRDKESRLALLHALCGRDHYGFVNGSILVNGVEELDMHSKYKSIIGVVARNMAMPPELKVHEMLRFTGHARLPKHTAYSEVSRKVGNVIRVLGMEDVKYDIIGNANQSGLNRNQRIFLGLAVELMSEPHALFIEEELIDSMPLVKSVQLMHCLQQIAKSGVTVVMIADRPRYDLFKMADDVLLLGRHHGIAYSGPTKSCLQYFTELDFKISPHYNPPDFFIDVVDGNVEKPGDPNFNTDKLLHYWSIKAQESTKPWYVRRVIESRDEEDQDTTDNKQRQRRGSDEDEDQGLHILDPEVAINDIIAQQEKKRRNIGFIGQYFMFALRALLQLARHMKGVMTDFILSFCMGSLLGGLYYNMEFLGPMSPTLQQQCPAFIKDQCALPRLDGVAPLSMMTVAGLAIVAMQGSLKTFGNEKKLFRREAQNGINKLSYFLGKLTADLPGLFLFPLIFLSIWFVLVSPRAQFLLFYGIFLLHYLLWRSYGYLLSVTFQRLHCELLGVMTILIGSLLGGLSPTWAVMKTKWYTTIFSGISPIRWAFELIYVVELKQYKRDGVAIDSALSYYGFSYKRIWLNLVVLFAFALTFLVGAFIVMVVRDPGTQSKVFMALRIRWRRAKRVLHKKVKRGGNDNKTVTTLPEDDDSQQRLSLSEMLGDDYEEYGDEDDNNGYQPPQLIQFN